MRPLAALALLLAFCGPARAWEKNQHLYEDVFTPFFRLDPASGEYRAARPDMDPEGFPAVKASNAFRVFIIGATTTHAYSGDDDLRHALARVLPDRKVEVMRCGLSAYDSYRETIILKEVLGYAPDLIIRISGVNELTSLYFPLPPWLRDIPDPYGPGPWRDRLAAWIKDHPGVSDATWFSQRDARLGEFFDNLVYDARLAGARGVPIILAAPPINYRGSTPNAPLPWAHSAFTPGWIAYLRGDFKKAAALWEPARDPQRQIQALIRFYLGRADEKLGRFAPARRAYAAAIDDGEFKFCAPRCLALIRRAAAEGGAAQADLDGAFLKFDAPRVPGLDLFKDQNQWVGKADALVSLELIRAMRADPKLAGLSWSKPALEELRKDYTAAARAPLPDEPTATMLHYALWELLWRKPKDDLLWPSADWFEEGLKRRPAWFTSTEGLLKMIGPTLDQANAGPDQLAQLRPQLYWHLGEARLRRGERKQALALFAQALKLDPTLYPALLSRGTAQALSGDAGAARRSLAQAAAHGLAPEAAELSAALGL